MRRALIVAVLASLPLPSRANAAKTLSADQLLASLADVMKDRAHQVAADIVLSELKEGLCSGIQVPLASKTVLTTDAAKCSKKEQKRKDPRTCEPVFIDTCELLRAGDIRLTDPHFFNTVAKDTIRFAVRAGAGALTGKQFADAHLGALARYIVAAIGAANDRSAETLAERTLDFVNDLAQARQDGPAFHDLFIDAALGDSSADMLFQVRRLVTESCGLQDAGAVVPAGYTPPPIARLQNAAMCGSAGLKAVLLSKASPTALPAAGSGQCKAYRGARAARERWFSDYFTDTPAQAGKAVPAVRFASARHDSCSNAGFEDGELTDCRLGHLLRLLDAFYGASCEESSANRNQAYRQLSLTLFYEWDAFQEAAASLNVAIGAQVAAAPEKIMKRAQRLIAVAARREMFGAFGVMAAYLRARQLDPDATDAWVKDLRADLAAEIWRDPLGRLYEAKALRWDPSGAKTSTQALRDEVKQFLYVAEYLARVKNSYTPNPGQAAALTSATEAITRLSAAAASLAEPQNDDTSVDPHLRRVAAVLRALASFTEAMSSIASDVATDGGTLPLATYSSVLSECARLMDLVATREWVGIAVAATQHLEPAMKGSASRALGLSRVVLAAYQAKTPEDAKAIFSGALEERMSRRLRFDNFAIDLGGMVAARWGERKLYDPAIENGTSSGQLIGLYAPFGVQLAWWRVGALVYPLDLGTYMLATGDNEDKPKWSDAVRVGGAAFFRFRRAPVVVGGSMDYRPNIETRSERRMMAFIGLELPMYLIR